MEITVILCTSNRSESLAHTLAALGKVKVRANMDPTLLVIDNASTDSTKEVVEGCGLINMNVEYVSEPRRGKCFALNTGIAKAKGEIVMFLDDDVRPPANWLEGMCEPIIAGKADAVVGGVCLAPHLERPWMTSLYRSLMGSTENQDPNNPFIIGGNLAVSRTVFNKVPGFDTELGPGALGCYEDTLFSKQIFAAGFRVVSAFEIVAEHHFDETRLLHSSLLDHAKKKGQSLAYLRYHWEYKDVQVSWGRITKDGLSLIKWRLANRRSIRSEGIEDKELTIVSHIHLRKQFLIERKRPRNYHAHGLVKL